MTDDGRFLSRRERRAQEAREATHVPADTDALEVGPISESIPTHAPDGRVLSRRERRRLERSRQPMETWTAEEEMIATGQIPAMTPERIAEQERLARERAAQAQREAEAASAELQGIAGHPAVTPAEDEPADEAPTEQAAQPEWAPVTEQTDSAPAEPEGKLEAAGLAPEWQAQPGADDVESAPQEQTPPEDSQPPERTSLIAAVAADVNPVEPQVSDEPQSVQAPDVSQAPHGSEEQHAPEASSLFETPEVTQEPEQPQAPETPFLQDEAPQDALASAPSAPATPQAEPTAPEIDEAPATFEPEPVAAIPGMPPGMSPEMFASLFPPGSLQRRLMEDQAANEAASQPEQEDPAAEIRRLTQEAVAGLDAASARSYHEPVSAQETPGDDQQTSQEDSAAAQGFTHPAEFAPSSEYAPSATEPTAPDPHQPSADYGYEPAPVEQPQSPWGAPASQSAPEPFGQPSSPSAPPTPEPDSGPPTFSIPAFDPEGQQGQTPAGSVPSANPPAEPTAAPPALAPLEEAPFDAILGDHPETAALDQASNAPGAFGSPAFGSVSAASAPSAGQPTQETHGFAPAPSANAPWGEHPLSQVNREAPELPEMPPAQSVPQPDLSSVGFRPQPSPTGPVPIVEPVPTGQIEVPPRERPELTGADVPRSFKWAHLAVFGAVGLLLGVVVWQVV